MGRIDHRKTGEQVWNRCHRNMALALNQYLFCSHPSYVHTQAGADLERVEQAKKYFPLDHVQMEPGDVLFFHCNLLHTRWRRLKPLRP
jgi:ectoine hydroxylase-related dioxygenase (phytanoyl-CoA dioxygenase family)